MATSLPRVVASGLLAALIAGCPAPVPALGADPAVLAYLERSLWTPTQGGTVACAYEVLASEAETPAETLYAWVHCGEYAGPAQAEPFGGRSGPVVVTRQPDGTVSHAAPRDGGAYAADVERMFPARVRRALFDPTSRRHRARIGRLEAASAARARSLGRLVL